MTKKNKYNIPIYDNENIGVNFYKNSIVSRNIKVNLILYNRFLYSKFFGISLLKLIKI